ncbi:MAG: SUMF1/EgtB/PvdO family nonheme iron enzyme [Deltaproteobacteria bacterium]|nr:SUMF1/EgtB/PvdO family nonheme iron enzyme [Deltaproteobacteria bacterium]
MPKDKDRHSSRPISFIGVILSLLFFPTSMPLDPLEVTNRDYMSFTQATGHSPPEYWLKGRYPPGMENEPVVLVTWHDAAAYCQWAGEKRLPTVDEWMAVCQAGRLEKQGDVWEWTSTDVPAEMGTFKALCGPKGTCDCSHRYHPDWKNMVKGFRCAQGSLHMARIGRLLRSENRP